jgi:acyl carrier protein
VSTTPATPPGGELDAVVRRVLDEVAPDVGASDADADADFHDDFGLDSMDTLNLAIGLAEATGVDIPERDYPRIVSISSTVAYLATHRPE